MSFLHDVAGDYKAWLQEQAEPADEGALWEGYLEWQAGTALQQLGPRAQRRVLQEVLGEQVRRLQAEQHAWEQRRDQCCTSGRTDASYYWTGKIHGMVFVLHQLMGEER
jgi:hypothetical protein